jgi:hypothetical protein
MVLVNDERKYLNEDEQQLLLVAKIAVEGRYVNYIDCVICGGIKSVMVCKSPYNRCISLACRQCQIKIDE